jgi:hypothetical protein
MLSITPLHVSCAVEWDKRLLPVIDYAGRESKRWITVGMPKLGQYNWLPNAVFYVYESADDARNGVKAGGTGFLVAIPSERWPNDFHHTYGVTNWHNACEAGASVIRVNRVTGPPDIIELDPSEWSFIPGPQGYDIAAIELTDRLKLNEHKVEVLGPSFLLTDDEIKKHEIGPADDVFMVGRFVDYDGFEVNEPSLRFGHISIARASIKQRNGCVRPSHVIDMHSRAGFSGSPVFVFRTHGSIFAREDHPFIVGGHLMKLLGIHWGQFPEEWEIKESGKSKPQREASLITQGAYVKGLSGMTCVCPASAILEVLNMPEIKKQREDKELLLAKAGFGRGLPIAESASAANDGNPNHREDFTSLLTAAAKTPPQAD